MFLLVVVLAASFAGCLLFDKKIHEVIQPAVFAVVLCVYVFALILPLSVAIWICVGIVVAEILAVSVKTWRNRQRTDRINVLKRVFTPQAIILLAVCVLLCALMSNRRVFFYDDLSYWAIYTKNIFCIDKLPHLFENYSVSYKDYTPIIQIMQYIALFGRKSFSEPVMFQSNVCLIYILLLPLISGFEDKEKPAGTRIVSVILYIIFPHILTSQFYYRLGVDLFLALVFGYSLYLIFDIRKMNKSGEEDQGGKLKQEEVFRMISLLLSLSFLALIKSSGIVLCIFAIILFAVREIIIAKNISSGNGSRLKALVKTALIVIFAFGSYFSWQLFLRYSWNNGYLSDRVKAGVTGGGLAFPEYTKEVVINYIKHFFTYPLTRNTWGVTAFVVIVFIVIAYIITRPAYDNAGSGKVYKTLFVCLIIGFILFCIAHLSMYLFVFDEWEAHGLLEFDRYITQYLGGLFFLYAYILIDAAVKDHGSGRKASALFLFISVAVFVAFLPYKDMSLFAPSVYESQFGDRYGQMYEDAVNEWKQSGIGEMGLLHDGSQRLTVVADSWDESTQFLEYVAVPQPIDSVINVPGIEAGEIVSFTEDRLEQYVYVAKNAPDSYAGDWSETAELTKDAAPLKGGTLYRLIKENDTKTLVPAGQ